MKRIINLILIQISLVSCMTMHLNYRLYPQTIQTSISIDSITALEEIDENSIRIQIPKLNKDYIYDSCYSFKFRDFFYCKIDSNNTSKFLKFENDVNYLISGKKAFIYYDRDFAFIHSNLKQNFYSDSNGQFGFPKSISISEDGLSRLITYYKPRPDLNDVCYHEKYNPNSNSFDFKEDCDRISTKSKFFPMKKVKLPKSIYINIVEDKFYKKAKSIFISPNYNKSIWLNLDYFTEKKLENPNILLYLLYPPFILFDIITFPIQIFVVPFGKTALG
ncbi:hypothetical protein [Leptospira limi]|uniref:Lipoprotein n=1 Tax=Leptospira limi TaxID=2950023 RepID=A0ABT3M231_9LEPT|nr:hypothetical protein [Leptospira limi]MCW7464036.1 hypothetical protein [Leptospira limi]